MSRKVLLSLNDETVAKLHEYSAEYNVPMSRIVDELVLDGGTRELVARIAKPKPRTPDTYMITRDGKTQSLLAWGRELGIPRSTLRYRFASGLTDDELLDLDFRWVRKKKEMCELLPNGEPFEEKYWP